MIEIFTAQNMLLEKKYIIDVFLRVILGFDYKITVDNNRDYRILLPNKKLIIIQDHFFCKFSKPDDYLQSVYCPSIIPIFETVYASEYNIPVIYGNPIIKDDDNILNCGIDLFASCFFMLTRWEECVNTYVDNHKRYHGKLSCAYRFNFLNRPIVNEYVELFYNLLCKQGYQYPKKNHVFSIIPTHDIDKIYFPISFKEIAADIYLTRRISNFNKRIKAKLRGINYYDTFDYLLNLSETFGVKSHFYFKSTGNSKFDINYDCNNSYIKKTIQNIVQRGHIIGFHPGYNTYNDPIEWTRQKKELENAINIEVFEGRQHYLRFRVPDTWEIWENNHMKIDSTLCYADCLGFRCGTTLPFPVYNVKKQQTYKLLEMPFVIFDSVLHSYIYNELSINEAINNILFYKNICKKYQIPLTFLVHNSSFDPIRWIGWNIIYESIVF